MPKETTSSSNSANAHVVRSPLSVRDLRVGNYLKKDGIIVQIDARSIFYIWDETTEYEPIPLTEEIIIKIRRAALPEFQPIEFAKYEPGERQIEFQYWSSWMNEDYKLHLCPSYDTDWIEGKPHKSKEIKFWFCWFCEGNKFISLKEIRGKNTLRYVHQLQNLFYQLTAMELVMR